MSGSRKKRMSMLDDLATAGAKPPAPAPPQVTSNRALRAARDAVDGHNVWDLDPAQIENRRLKDRLEPGDLDALRRSIETNGQTVPILVRRHPEDSERYLLVYGMRRLEAIRTSDKVATVRAIIANVDEASATRAQIAENTGRRDLTYIERALFADELVAKGFGNQAHVAEILTATKSSISMALGVVEAVGRDLAEAIGPAPGIGRPRWEALATALRDERSDREELLKICHRVHGEADQSAATGRDGETEASVLAFEEVMRALPSREPVQRKQVGAKSERIPLSNGGSGEIRQTSKGVYLCLYVPLDAVPDWPPSDAQSVVEELHARWIQRAED